MFQNANRIIRCANTGQLYIIIYIHFYEHEFNVPTLMNKVPLIKTSSESGIGSPSRVQVITGLGAPNV